MILLPFFWKIFPFQISIFSKMSIILKFPNSCIIISKTTYFENIQYCKIYFHYGLGLTKTRYNYSASFFGRYSHFKLKKKLKQSIFLKFSNRRKITVQTNYFKNIQYCKIYIHYGLGLAKTSYNDSASFFWKISTFQVLNFFKMFIFFKFSNYRIILAQTIYFENIQYCEINIQNGIGLAKTSYNDSASFF